MSVTRSKRAERRLAHLCTECGESLPKDETHVTCQACRDWRRRKYKCCPDKRKAYQQARRLERIAQHLCTVCGEILEDDYYYTNCERCRERQRKWYRENCARIRADYQKRREMEMQKKAQQALEEFGRWLDNFGGM